MPKNVQIRNVDDATYETLRARAAAADLSLTQYLRRELDRLAGGSTMQKLLAETDEWRARTGGVSREAVEQAFAESRDERENRGAW